MEIGGYDTIFETNHAASLANQIVFFLGWDEGIIEKDSGEGFENDFFYYKDKKSKEFWDDMGAPDFGDDNMVHFVVHENSLTVVADKKVSELIRKVFKGE